MKQNYVLCQVNLAHCKYPLEHEAMADFVNALDRINRLADEHEGFIWRFKSAESNEESPWPAHILPNMSVWSNIASLKEYVYRSIHVDFIRRKKEWFLKPESIYQALWWIPTGTLPTLADAKKRLELLEKVGPTSYSFTFAKPFAPPAESRPENPASAL